MKIGTHSGRFHSDDVCAVATLLVVFPEAEVIRTRDETILATCDIRVDIGRIYNPKTCDYDHHQGGVGIRKNGIEYSSFGLILKEYGIRLAGDEETARYVDRVFAQVIDARDNGLSLYKPNPKFGGAKPFDFADGVDLFNPNWDEERDADAAFMEAVKMAQNVLKRVIARAKAINHSRHIVRHALEAAADPRIIVLACGCPWVEVVLEEAPQALFVIFLGDEGNWRLQCVPVSLSGYDLRRRLPGSWLENSKTLAEITGVPDAYFVHNKLFLCSAKSLEGALQLAHLAMATP